MAETPLYEEVFIESLGKHLRIRLLTAEDMEILESIPERDRASELVLQGLYDCKELMDKLTSVIGSELVSMMVDARTTPLLARLARIKEELLDAIYQVNQLRVVRFRDGEEILSGNLAYRCHIDHRGRLILSDPETAADP